MVCDQRTRLLQELATCPRSEEQAVLWRYGRYLLSLPARERADLLAELEDIVIEKG